MTRAELLDLHRQLCVEARSLMERKNRDYAGQANRDQEDPFANFRLAEALGLSSAEVGLLTRLGDKMARLSTFATAGQLHVKDESARDTILDVINYSVLLAGLIQDRADRRPKLDLATAFFVDGPGSGAIE